MSGDYSALSRASFFCRSAPSRRRATPHINPSPPVAAGSARDIASPLDHFTRMLSLRSKLPATPVTQSFLLHSKQAARHAEAAHAPTRGHQEQENVKRSKIAGGLERSDFLFYLYHIRSEPDLRGKLRASGAGKLHHDLGSPAVWSAATESIDRKWRALQIQPQLQARTFRHSARMPRRIEHHLNVQLLHCRQA